MIIILVLSLISICYSFEGGIFQSGHNGYDLTHGDVISIGCYAILPYNVEELHWYIGSKEVSSEMNVVQTGERKFIVRSILRLNITFDEMHDKKMHCNILTRGYDDISFYSKQFNIKLTRYSMNAEAMGLVSDNGIRYSYTSVIFIYLFMLGLLFVESNSDFKTTRHLLQKIYPVKYGKVFLGGSNDCDKWRDEVIPVFNENNIEYYNPRKVKNENKSMKSNNGSELYEIDGAEDCDRLFYLINGNNRSFASMIEIMYLASREMNLIITIENIKSKINGNDISQKEIEQLDDIRSFLRYHLSKMKIPLFVNLKDAIYYTVKQSKRYPPFFKENANISHKQLPEDIIKVTRPIYLVSRNIDERERIAAILSKEEIPTSCIHDGANYNVCLFIINSKTHGIKEMIEACYYINESNVVKNRCFFLMENVKQGDVINRVELTQDAASDYNQARVHFKQLVAQATINDQRSSIAAELIGIYEIHDASKSRAVTEKCLSAAIRCATEIAHDNYEWNQ